MLATRPASQRRRLDRTVSFLIFVGLLAFYIAIQRGTFESFDGRCMAGVARNIWQHADVHTFRNSFGAKASSRPGWSIFGIGTSLLMAPLWGLQLASDPHEAVWLTMTGPLLTAGAGVMVFRISTSLGFRALAATLATLSFGLLTLAPVYSTELFSEPGVTFAILSIAFGLLRWQCGARLGPWLVGLGVAWAVLFRFDSIVIVAPAVLGAVMVPRRALLAEWRTWVPALTLPIGAAIVWTG